MTRFPVEHYASLELNQVAFPKTGMVISQTPLADTFTKQAPCENGMWLVADKAAGVLKAPADADADSPIGIVYTAEKEYNPWEIGLKHFAQVGGDYPRVGIFSLGDTVTSNCFQYDENDYATFAALETVLKAAATTPVYVAGVDGSAVPELTATQPSGGCYGKVVKYYTMPNGEKGVKYEIVHI